MNQCEMLRKSSIPRDIGHISVFQTWSDKLGCRKTKHDGKNDKCKQISRGKLRHNAAFLEQQGLLLFEVSKQVSASLCDSGTVLSVFLLCSIKDLLCRLLCWNGLIIRISKTSSIMATLFTLRHLGHKYEFSRQGIAFFLGTFLFLELCWWAKEVYNEEMEWIDSSRFIQCLPMQIKLSFGTWDQKYKPANYAFDTRLCGSVCK